MNNILRFLAPLNHPTSSYYNMQYLILFWSLQTMQCLKSVINPFWLFTGICKVKFGRKVSWENFVKVYRSENLAGFISSFSTLYQLYEFKLVMICWLRLMCPTDFVYWICLLIEFNNSSDLISNAFWISIVRLI